MWDLSGPEIKPASLHWQEDSLPPEPPGKPLPVYSFKQPVSLQHRFWLLQNYAWQWLWQLRTKLSSSCLVAGFSAFFHSPVIHNLVIVFEGLTYYHFSFLVFSNLSLSPNTKCIPSIGFYFKMVPNKMPLHSSVYLFWEFLSTPSSSSQSWGLGFMFGMLFMQFLNFIPPIKENARKAHCVCIFMELCFSFWSLWRKKSEFVFLIIWSFFLWVQVSSL